MDEMEIKSSILTDLISRAIQKIVRNKFGVPCAIKINEISFSNNGIISHIKIEVEGEVRTEQLPRIYNKIMNKEKNE